MVDASQAIWYHVVTVMSLVAFKLAVLFVGYLVAKLGHDLLVKGVTGQFKFQTSFRGTTADLASASPGIFFILMATVMIAIAVLKDKPFETRIQGTTQRFAGAQVLPQDSVQKKPALPPLEER